eukprot:1248147-Karenia_brevis.AAC.1
MESFGVHERHETNSQSWAGYKRLTVRWVKQKKGDIYRCRVVARDFKALAPEKPGLFTSATTP